MLPPKKGKEEVGGEEEDEEEEEEEKGGGREKWRMTKRKWKQKEHRKRENFKENH